MGGFDKNDSSHPTEILLRQITCSVFHAFYEGIPDSLKIAILCRRVKCFSFDPIFPFNPINFPADIYLAQWCANLAQSCAHSDRQTQFGATNCSVKSDLFSMASTAP